MNTTNTILLDYVHQNFWEIQDNNIWISDNYLLILPFIIIILLILSINFYFWPYFILKSEENKVKKQKEQKKLALKQIILQKQIEEEIEKDIKNELDEKIRLKSQ